MLIELALIGLLAFSLLYPTEFGVKALKLIQKNPEISKECTKSGIITVCEDRIIIDERGSTLVSFLTQLSVISIILSISVTELSDSFKASGLVTREIKEQEKLYHVAGILKLITRELDYHRYPISPKIFKDKVIFSNGSALNIKKKGDAISSLTFYGDTSLVVQEKNGSTFFGCFRERPSKVTDFLLGISPDGMSLYVASKEIGSKQCDSFEIRGVPSLTLPESNIRTDTIRIFYPVSREYLIYLSEGNELRYVQFKGERILEHQPLESDIFDLTLSLTEVSNLYLLETIISSKNRELSLPLFHALTRVDPFIFLYNL